MHLAPFLAAANDLVVLVCNAAIARRVDLKLIRYALFPDVQFPAGECKTYKSSGAM